MSLKNFFRGGKNIVVGVLVTICYLLAAVFGIGGNLLFLWCVLFGGLFAEGWLARILLLIGCMLIALVFGLLGGLLSKLFDE